MDKNNGINWRRRIPIMKGFRRIVIALLLAAAAIELLLPVVLSNIVNQGMMSLAASNNVTTHLSKRPALLMLGGKFDEIRVTAEQAKIDKFVFSSMNITLKNAQLDMGKLFSTRAVEFQSVGDVDIEAVVTQEDLAQYLNQTMKGIKNAVVEIQSGKVKASSNLSLGGFANIAISLEGKIVADGQKIKFVTEKILLNNRMTGNLGGSLLTEIPLVDLNKMPFPVNVRNIEMENGKVIVYLDNRPH